MSIVFFNATQTGSNDFSGQQTAFIDVANINLMSPATVAVIVEYSYSALGAAHDALLQLSPTAGSADNDKIELENLTGINTFTAACEIVVPKSSSNISFVALFATSNGKTGTGTLRIAYEIRTY